MHTQLFVLILVFSELCMAEPHERQLPEPSGATESPSNFPLFLSLEDPVLQKDNEP